MVHLQPQSEVQKQTKCSVCLIRREQDHSSGGKNVTVAVKDSLELWIKHSECNEIISAKPLLSLRWFYDLNVRHSASLSPPCADALTIAEAGLATSVIVRERTPSVQDLEGPPTNLSQILRYRSL